MLTAKKKGVTTHLWNPFVILNSLYKITKKACKLCRLVQKQHFSCCYLWITNSPKNSAKIFLLLEFLTCSCQPLFKNKEFYTSWEIWHSLPIYSLLKLLFQDKIAKPVTGSCAITVNRRKFLSLLIHGRWSNRFLSCSPFKKG